MVALAMLLAVPALAPAQVTRTVTWPAEKTVGNFHCHADFPFGRDELLLAQLGELSREISEILGLPPAREPVHLFLLHDRETYQAYMKQHFPRVPARRAMFIKSKGPGMVFAYKGDEFEIDVRHESTHAVLHAVVRDLPLWLDEGLAEYFEVRRDDRPSNNPHLADIRQQLRAGHAPRLEALEAITEFDDLGRAEYRDSFGWVHFMLHGPRAAHEELVAYLTDQQQGRDTEPLSSRLRRRLPDLDRRFIEHIRP
ncbi:hypothetical protein ETAA8_26200 [Anatilimnocola aggregata]|uniref:DUF1570 domain-containing protein n=2 Tax=Anatilimnocola aggregata TaxID=2528021 RepID=A0A517YBN0_9BACT|nr:hypothetical protein ETAA8_26200 [Anatilimnocola aggregata]